MSPVHGPDKRRAQAANEGSETLGTPHGAHTVYCVLVLLSVRGRESVGLHPGLDHVYWVDDRPELCPL